MFENVNVNYLDSWVIQEDRRIIRKKIHHFNISNIISNCLIFEGFLVLCYKYRQYANATMAEQGGGLEWVVESTTSYTFPVQTGGIFYFPWHRHQIEGTDGFSVSSKRHWQSRVNGIVKVPKRSFPQRDSNPAGNRPVASPSQRSNPLG